LPKKGLIGFKAGASKNNKTLKLKKENV